MFDIPLLQWRPDKYWLADAEHHLRWTPDLATLQLSQFQLLFVCDDMKHDWDSYEKIRENSARIPYRAFTMKNFKYYCRTVDSEKTFIPLRSDKTEFELTPVIPYVPSCKIAGELHAVESEHFTKLDELKQNGVQFLRQRIKLLVPWREMPLSEWKDVDGRPLPLALKGKTGVLSSERVHIIEAWMYVGIPEYWNDLLDGGFLFNPVWVSEAFQSKRWLRQYYNLVHSYAKPVRRNR